MFDWVQVIDNCILKRLCPVEHECPGCQRCPNITIRVVRILQSYPGSNKVLKIATFSVASQSSRSLGKKLWCERSCHKDTVRHVLI